MKRFAEPHGKAGAQQDRACAVRKGRLGLYRQDVGGESGVTTSNVPRSGARPRTSLLTLAAIGPGILVMLADIDAGNVATAARSGAHWGFRLLPLVLVLIPVLYIVQELTVRLGIFTHQGLGELVRARFGRTWSVVAGVALLVVVVASLVTEFTGVAGVGEIYGVSRNLCVPLAGVALLLIGASGSYRRIEYITLWIGLFQLAFFAVAGAAHSDMRRVVREMTDLPIGDGGFWFLGAALIGATFNPWMMFYQQSAVVDKALGERNLWLSRAETAFGAALAQLLTAAVLYAAAISFGPYGFDGDLETVGQISRAMTPLLGPSLGPLVFSVGVLGASMVAAVVCSLALAWGIGELSGIRRALEHHPERLRWFFVVYTAGITVAAAIVLLFKNLLWLNIVAQVVNVFILPVILAFLIILAKVYLPERSRLRGWYLWLALGLSVATCACGLIGAAQGIFGNGSRVFAP
jgi:Mn2+/Fe2+ NRAMP family transporter